MPSVQQELRDTLHQRLLPPVPSFVGNKVGEDLCVTILSMARGDRFEHALAYGKRGEWLKSKMPLLLTRVLEYLLFIDAPELDRPKTFKEAEAALKILYNNRMNQPDTTGGVQERKPLTLVYSLSNLTL